MSTAALDVTDETFQAEVLDCEVPVLVDFWAPWCAPCRAMGPVIDRLAEESGDTLRVVKINTEEASGTAMRYAVTSIPRFLLIKDGEVVETMIGQRPYEDLQATVAQHL